MKKSFLFLLGLLLSLALLFPLAWASGDLYLAFFIAFVMSATYIINYVRLKRAFMSFVSAMVFGVFFSISFWLLSYIDILLHLRDNLVFIGGFFCIFVLTSTFVLYLKESLVKKVTFSILAGLSLAGFILLTLLDDRFHEGFWIAALFGGLVGVFTATFSAYAFDLFIKFSAKIFSGLVDYIAILLKPFLVFFCGYICIALIYAGVYHLLLICNPQALSIPNEQLKLLDLILYSLDTMTTGGNSRVNVESMLAQFVNTLNVFTAIIWMTIMLAATIAYTSESFSEIAEKHRKKAKKKKPARKDEPVISI